MGSRWSLWPVLRISWHFFAQALVYEECVRYYLRAQIGNSADRRVLENAFKNQLGFIEQLALRPGLTVNQFVNIIFWNHPSGSQDFFQIVNSQGKKIYYSLPHHFWVPEEDSEDPLLLEVFLTGIPHRSFRFDLYPHMIKVILPVILDDQRHLVICYHNIQAISDAYYTIFHLMATFGDLYTIFILIAILCIVFYLQKPFREFLAYIQSQQGTILEGVELKLPQHRIGEEFAPLIELITGLNNQVALAYRKLVVERNQRDLLLHSIQDGILAMDHQGHLTYANPAAYAILGRHLEKRPQPADPSSSKTPLSAIYHLCSSAGETKRLTSHTIEFTDEDALQRHLEVEVQPIEGQNFTILIRDRTHAHQLQLLQKTFIANASHELRTPITVITGFAEMIKEHPHQLSGERMADAMERILNNCYRMNSLISALMQLAQIEEKPLLLVPCNIAALTLRVVEECHSNHQQIRFYLQGLEEPVHIVADATLIEIVVRNLLENALRYSPPDSSITIHLRSQGSYVYLKVIDQGIGIPQGDLPYIFERFYTADKARSKEAGGHGLGLAVVKTVVERHGGKVEVESVLGKGSTFTVTFPVDEDVPTYLVGYDGNSPLR